MSLFKPFRGTESELNSVGTHDGYAYFTTDKENFYVDIAEDDGTVTRHQANAYAADVLRSSDGTEEANIDDINAATSVAYTTTLYASGWVTSGDTSTYTYSNTSLTCGKDGNVPPIVTYTDNLDDYSKIDSAEATAGVGITFTTSETIDNDINIIIIDVK